MAKLEVYLNEYNDCPDARWCCPLRHDMSLKDERAKILGDKPEMAEEVKEVYSRRINEPKDISFSYHI